MGQRIEQAGEDNFNDLQRRTPETKGRNATAGFIGVATLAFGAEVASPGKPEESKP